MNFYHIIAYFVNLKGKRGEMDRMNYFEQTNNSIRSFARPLPKNYL